MSRQRIKECVICHKLFSTTSATAKYCSRECRMRGRKPDWTGGQSRWGLTYEHVCKWCGKTFISGSPHGDFCSNNCRKKAMKEFTQAEEKKKTIGELVKEAEEIGLSYGQYVARQKK